MFLSQLYQDVLVKGDNFYELGPQDDVLGTQLCDIRGGGL